jgi:hypothetical protein
MQDLLPSYCILYSSCWLLTQQEQLWVHKTFSLYLGMIGFISSNLVSRIVVNHVTKQPFPRWTAAFLPVIFGCIISVFQDYSNFQFNWHYFTLAGYIWVVLMQLHYLCTVFKTVANYLKINILTIKHKPDIHVERENTNATESISHKESPHKKTPVRTPKHEKNSKLKRVLDTPIRQSPRFKRIN